MKKMLHTLMASVLFFIVAAFNVFGQEKAEAPTYKDGDFWQFKVTEKGMTTTSTSALDGNYDVSFSDGKVSFRSTGGQASVTRKEFGELGRMLGVEEERQYLQFPLVVGNKWSTRYQAATRLGSGYRTAETSATAVEDVTTPAGTFRVFKIERYDVGRGGGPQGKGRIEWTYTYYYSPQTQSIVKYSLEYSGGGTREIELIKFGKNP